LHPIVNGAEFAARELDDLANRTEREITQLEELATQCSRALRNLSVNREFSFFSYKLFFMYSDSAVNKAAINSLGASRALQILATNPSERIAQQVEIVIFVTSLLLYCL
jgi:uncharacterized tellurite resistance protein B-like protein